MLIRDVKLGMENIDCSNMELINMPNIKNRSAQCLVLLMISVIEYDIICR